MLWKLNFGIVALLLQNANGFVRLSSKPIKFDQNILLDTIMSQKKVSALADSISKVSFRVKNLEQSISFHTGPLRMKIIEKNDAEKKCLLGYETSNQHPFYIEIQSGVADELSVGDVSY